MADVADMASEMMARSEEMIPQKIARIVNTVSQVTECGECGEEIPEKRKKAAPWSTRCAPCQEVFESKSRHYRQGI